MSLFAPTSVSIPRASDEVVFDTCSSEGVHFDPCTDKSSLWHSVESVAAKGLHKRRECNLLVRCESRSHFDVNKLSPEMSPKLYLSIRDKETNKTYLFMEKMPLALDAETIYSYQFSFFHLAFNTLSAVLELDKQGRVHHDIKPQNFMLRSSSKICITDFGLSTKMSEYMESKDINKFGGTTYYCIHKDLPKHIKDSLKSRKDLIGVGYTLLKMFFDGKQLLLTKGKETIISEQEFVILRGKIKDFQILQQKRPLFDFFTKEDVLLHLVTDYYKDKLSDSEINKLFFCYKIVTGEFSSASDAIEYLKDYNNHLYYWGLHYRWFPLSHGDLQTQTYMR